MTFSDWIEAERGRLSQVADHFGVSRSAITQWKENGVPLDRMVAVCGLSDGVVSISDMVIERAKPEGEAA